MWRRTDAADDRRTISSRYAVSQRIRKRTKESSDWIKTAAGLRKARFHGLAPVDLPFTLAAAADHLVRLPKLLAPR